MKCTMPAKYMPLKTEEDEEETILSSEHLFVELQLE